MRISYNIASALTLAAFLTTAAVGDDGTVKGEVFIVTEAAENVRLGLVEILVFTEAAIQKHIEERKSHITDEMPDFEKEISRHDEIMATAKKTIEDLKNLYARNRQFQRKIGEIPSIAQLTEEDDRIKLFQNIITWYESSKKTVLQAKQNWPAPRHFFKNLPETKSSARTNADGKFTLGIPKEGKFAVVAHATRKTDRTYEYYWMVWVSLDGKDSKEIVLGNHNLMSAGSKESVISTKSD
jgi:hypothetical protein